MECTGIQIQQRDIQGVEKFLIMKYFEFSMVDNVFMMDQVHELKS